ncbi:MAG: LCP family protein [Bacteroidota bacterium]
MGFGIFLLGIIFYAGYVFVQSTETWEATFSETNEQHVVPNKTGKDYVSVLFLGLDENDLKEGRSDFIMFTLINLKSGEITAISIPRDSKIELNDDHPDKLNHAYTYSPETAMISVEKILDFPVDYYFALNLDSFKKFIDTIGGIEIAAEKNMDHKSISIEKGKQQMDGETALKYVRFRTDNEGDFGRMRRQQQVLDAIIDQIINIETAANINDFFELAEQNIRHNIPLDSLLSNAPGLSNISPSKFNRKRLRGDIVEIDSLWYVELDSTQLLNIRDDLRTEYTSTQ